MNNLSKRVALIFCTSLWFLLSIGCEMTEKPVPYGKVKEKIESILGIVIPENEKSILCSRQRVDSFEFFRLFFVLSKASYENHFRQFTDSLQLSSEDDPLPKAFSNLRDHQDKRMRFNSYYRRAVSDAGIEFYEVYVYTRKRNDGSVEVYIEAQAKM